ncbi:MAG TPA: XdhC family protein, partial [Acidobacteriota bacterium]
RYLGILGPRDRTDRMLDELGAKQQERIYGPVGLDLGAEGPEQVALSIVAELLAVWSGGSCRSLREKGAPIHS